MSEKQIYFLILLYMYLNLFATWKIYNTATLKKEIKIFYIIVVWLLPFLGYVYIISKDEIIHKTLHKKVQNSTVEVTKKFANNVSYIFVSIIYIGIFIYLK